MTERVEEVLLKCVIDTLKFELIIGVRDLCRSS